MTSVFIRSNGRIFPKLYTSMTLGVTFFRALQGPSTKDYRGAWLGRPEKGCKCCPVNPTSRPAHNINSLFLMTPMSLRRRQTTKVHPYVKPA